MLGEATSGLSATSRWMNIVSSHDTRILVISVAVNALMFEVARMIICY